MLQGMRFRFEHDPCVRLFLLAQMEGGQHWTSSSSCPAESPPDILAMGSEFGFSRRMHSMAPDNSQHMSALAFLDGQCLLLCHNALLYRS